MSFTYTLVVYRPNGVDTCRNCVMGTSESDFDIQVFSDRNALAEWRAKHYFNEPSGREYCNPQYTLLLDGLREEDESWDRPDSEERDQERREVERLFTAAHARLDAEATEKKTACPRDG